MKKNFLKKLASVLSLALVVSTITPAASASAAAAPNLAKRYTNVYEGNGYAYTVKNAKGHTVKWTVSGAGAEYVNLSKKTGASTKLTIDTEGEAAAKNKNVTVKANFYKGGKLVKAAGDVVKVKVSATGLGIVAADADVDLTAVAAGEVVDFNRTITPKNATSVTYWSVTDKDGNATTDATVDGTGNFKADKVGEYVVKAVARNAKNGKDIVTAEQAVKVVVAITNATQQSVTKLDVLFNVDMKDAKIADFSIVNDTTKATIAVKAIEVDGKKVTVETFADINDGKTYTVKYKDISAQFTATDNKPASIVISPATIEVQKATKIEVLVKDANGVLLSANPYANPVDNKVEFNIETTTGYTDGSKLVLFKVGDTAKAKATYHTYEYTDGKEVGALTTELTITAVDKTALIMKENKYTIADNAPSNWNTATLNDKLAIDEEKRIFVYLKDSDDNVAKNTDGYQLVSSNDNVLLVQNIDGVSAYIKALKAESAYVLVKDKDGKVILSLPVNIVAERKAAALKLSSNSITLSKIATNDSKDVTIELKDQYGDKIAVAKWPTGATITRVSGDASSSPTNLSAVNDKITFRAIDFINSGVYSYNVKIGDFVQNVRIDVRNVDAAVTGLSYNFDLSDNQVDLAVNSETDNKSITAKVEILRGGVFAQHAGIRSFEVKNLKTGTVVASGAALTAPTLHAADAIDVSAISVNKPGKTAVKNLGEGNYVVTVKVPKYTYASGAYTPSTNPNEDLTFTGGFVVTDTQAKVSVKQIKTVADASNLHDAIIEAFEFTYEGVKIENPVVTSVVKKDITNTKTFYVESVKVDVIADGITVSVNVDINKSITIK